MNLKSFDRVAHCYDDTRGMPPEASRAIGDAIAAMARKVSPSPRLLEVGIGTGRIAVPLAEAGVRVTGIDISPNMLGVLREKRRDIDVLLAEAAHPPLREATFDAALFVHILHLVPDAEATLRATARLVHPGGVILFGFDQGRIGQREQADAIIARAVEEIAHVPIPTRDAHDEARATTERVLRDTRRGGLDLDRRQLARARPRPHDDRAAVPQGLLQLVADPRRRPPRRHRARHPAARCPLRRPRSRDRMDAHIPTARRPPAWSLSAIRSGTRPRLWFIDQRAKRPRR